MDDAKKNTILSHLDKIEQFARQPGNEWLLMELEKRFGKSDIPAGASLSCKNIEHYLALDYSIDDMASKIDYSFIEDNMLRMKLVSDWREMLRYRCYVRKHRPDFLEFCRYANLQAEGVTNYYCGYKYPTDEELHVACGIKEDKSVTYFNKLVLLYKNQVISFSEKEFFFKKLYAVRNIQSHRGATSLSEYVDKARPILSELIKQYNLPTTKGDNSLLNTYRITYSDKDSYEQSFEQFKQALKTYNIDYTRYEVLNWCYQTPYEEVEAKLESIVSKIRNSLSKTI